MNIEEWWENHTSPEFREDVKAYHGIDLDWFKCRIPEFFWTRAHEKWYVRINSFCMIEGQFHMEFLLTLEDECKRLLVAEKFREPFHYRHS